MRVDGLDNARMLLHTCKTHSKGIGLNSKHEDLSVSRVRCTNPAADLNFTSPHAPLIWISPSRALCWHHDVGRQRVTNPFATLEHTHLRGNATKGFLKRFISSSGLLTCLVCFTCSKCYVTLPVCFFMVNKSAAPFFQYIKCFSCFGAKPLCLTFCHIYYIKLLGRAFNPDVFNYVHLRETTDNKLQKHN